MNNSNVTIGKEAQQKLLDGMSVAIAGVRLSYGPAGINAAVENQFFPYSETANDAETIIQAIQVTDPVEKVGLNYLKELSSKADKDSGDGRKTTLLIAESILQQAFKSGMSGIALKRELDALIPIVEQNINEQRKEITAEEVHKVATIAGESERIGSILGEIYKKIGKEGIIIPEGSGTFETYYSFIEGVRFVGTGFLSPYMVHDEQAKKEGRKETEAIYENPTILVTKRKISHLNDINPLLETLQRQGKKDLVIFTNDMDSGVASIMVKAHQDRVMNILIIKAPVLFGDLVFEDFAKITGSTIVEDSSGINFKNLTLDHLGTCGMIRVDKEETTIVGGADIADHIAELKKGDDFNSKLRLSWLQTKTALLKLGANSESELSYIRLKTKDAISASILALKGGVVEGGGISLLKASDCLPNTTAGSILSEALKVPITQLCANAGIEIPQTFGSEVIDAAAVVKNAVRNAVSLASTVLTTGMVIVIPPKSADQIAAEALQGNKLRF